MELSLTPLLAFISIAKLLAFAKAALGLGFVIFVHELGHFVVAKLCGVKCEKFYVGFDVPIRIGPIQFPRALFRKQWGETEYGIGIVPLGGYVKMLGQDDNPANSAKEAERIRQVRQDSAAGDETLGQEIDPRSYPAKTVLQRLMIISAGVIMNLIFAVIFGMVAYRLGVTYIPTVVGSTSPGLSAWEVGLQTGDRIVQLGREGDPSEHLRFTHDMMVTVMMTGANRQMDLLVDRYTPPGQQPQDPEWITVYLSSPQKELLGRPVIGIGPPGTTEITASAEARELLGHLPVYQVENELKQGDRIVAVDGTPIEDYAQLTRELARKVDQPVRLGIKRPASDPDSSGASGESFDVTVAPAQGRELGLILTMGPITAIQRGSIAEQVGLKVGDRLISIGGEPVADPMRVPDRLRQLAGETVELVVRRADESEPVAISLVPQPPSMLHSGFGLSQSVPVEAVGFAFTIENVVAAVVPDSPAAAAGMLAGDVVQAAEFEAATEEASAIEKELFPREEPIELGEEQRSWPRVHDRMRLSQLGTQVVLTYQRGDQLKTAKLVPNMVDDWHYADRGINTMTMEEIHQVESWGTAFWLGWRETVEGMRQVYFILFRLVTGQLSPKNLGGPISIAELAGAEASQSTARLLVFLTLLSANLAVVNFLPIPVLDGGHAMFLLYEGIFRKPVNERIAFGLTLVGFCFVLALMAFVIGLDVWRKLPI